jgi:hypothetical protein
MYAILRMTGAVFVAAILFLGPPIPDGGLIENTDAHPAHPIRRALHRQIRRVHHRMKHGKGNPARQKHLLRRDHRLIRLTVLR